jgi:hypothetical protein
MIQTSAASRRQSKITRTVSRLSTASSVFTKPKV